MKTIEDVLGGRRGWHAAPLGTNWRPAVIGVDCDGVLASDRLLWERLRERYPEHIPARYDDLATFDWPRATPETTALCMELSADPEFAERLAPMPRMVEALRRLDAASYEIHVITARPACVRGATRRWLRRHGVSDCVRGIHCVESGLAKVPVALRLGCEAFVEDNYVTAEAMGAAGIRSYLLDAPYNRGASQHSRRVRGWRSLLGDLMDEVPPQRIVVPAAASRLNQPVVAGSLAS